MGPMIWKTLRAAAVAVCFALPSDLHSQSKADTPESTIRGVIRAMYAADGAAFAHLMLPDPRIHMLTTGGSVNERGLRDLDEDPQGVQIIPRRTFEFRGADASPDSLGQFPIGTTAVYMVAHHSSPMVMVLEKRAEGWKVDPRWWLAAVEMSAGVYSENGTPSSSARSLLAALLDGDRDRAAALATPGASMELLFAGAPRQREPSGHLEALVAEMPIVEMKPGEFRRLVTGEVVEGSTSSESRLLVGLMGSVEIPFVVVNVGGAWRVRPQPFFDFINR
jgi:hypothetical protein